MTSVTRAMSGAAGRLLTRPREHREGYAFCREDRFWFRPLYTEGKCPLCGEIVPGGAPSLPLLLRADRFSLGMATLALVSLIMGILVLVMYFHS